MREFEDRFVTLGLPYRVIGGPRFYERAEIRDALAYLRVIHSPTDDLAFERIVNTPKRGLGDATIQMLHDHARKRRIPLTEAARAVAETDELKPKPRNALRTVIDNFDRWRAQKDTLPHTELAEIVLDESGYTEMWQNDKSADAAGRLENLKELVRSMEEFENLAGFLEHISLVMDADERRGRRQAVSIMTLHSAKGLEFDTVFLPGWEEGLFPHQRTLDEQGRAGLEEERRLGHVGLTRARKRAKICFATNRRIHGLWQTNIPSRFLDELPEAQRRGDREQGLRSAAAAGLRRVALRQHDGVRLELFDAGLAARPGQQEPRRLLRDRRAALRRARASATTRSTTSIRSMTTMRPRRHLPRGQAGAEAPKRRQRARRSPSRASWWRNRPAPRRISPSATGCFTRSSATATSPWWTATSSPSRSTRPARSAWWIVLWRGCDGAASLNGHERLRNGWHKYLMRQSHFGYSPQQSIDHSDGLATSRCNSEQNS